MISPRESRDIAYELNKVLQIETKPEIGYFWHDENGKNIRDKIRLDPSPQLESDGTYKVLKEVKETFQNDNNEWISKTHFEPTGETIKVVQVPFEIQRFRQASSDDDYKIIFENAFKKKRARNLEKFRVFHIMDMKKKVAILQEDNYEIFYDIIELTQIYIDFLCKELERNINPLETMDGKGLSLVEIALICIYIDQHINSTNANDILKKYNSNFYSGRKLIERYNSFYTNPHERVALSEHKHSDNMKLKNFNRVIEYLESNGYDSEVAKKERDTFNLKINKFYS